MHRLVVKTTRAHEDAAGPKDRTSRHHWWPVAFSKDLVKDPSRPLGVTLFGEPLALFVDAAGDVQCVADVCAHQSAALSQGTVVGGELVCRYHGWRYGTGGRCTHPAELSGKRGTTLYGYPAVDDGHLVWVYPSHDAPVPFVNPLVELARRAGAHPSVYLAKELEFHQAWELWQASFVDHKHRDHAHPKTILSTQQASTVEYFDPELSPAATAVSARHDKVLGLFTYLVFSPVDEQRHRQFLTLFPVSEVLPASVALRVFTALRLPKVIEAIAYEDYVLIVKQAERIALGAPKWGIRGKYGASEAAERFIDWHVGHEKDEVWFDGYGEGGRPRLRAEAPARRRLDVVPDPKVEDSGFELGPYAGGDRTLREPRTWSGLGAFDTAVKHLAGWVSR